MISKKSSNHQIPHDRCHPFTAEQMMQQLKRILGSDEFHATKSQRKLLEYVIQKTVSGEIDQIKGYPIATQIFGRKEDFDLNTDPIVSIHANKLRSALERYYFTAGIHDPIRVEIPKGTYIPLFTENQPLEREWSKNQNVTWNIPSENSWPTLLIQPFQCLTQDQDEKYLSIGLATELAVELNEYNDVRVILQNSDGYRKHGSITNIRFKIGGTLRYAGKEVRLSIQLLDTHNGVQLWGESHQFKFDAETISKVEKKIAQSIAAKLAGECGIIAQTVSAESKDKRPTQLKTYEAILRYYEFDRNLKSESFISTLEALDHASTIEPSCGPVWSMLGRLYGNVYAFETPGFENALKMAVSCAEKGVQLNPDSQKARTVLGYVRMLCNELPAAISELKKALNSNKCSPIFIDGIGYMLILLGEYGQGTEMIRQAIQQNPYYNPIVHYALWVDNIRQEKYDQAHVETLNFYRPDFFWEPLMKASTFGLLGREGEGKISAQQLLTLKPDFQNRGRILISHYIKFDAIRERIIKGLSEVGIILD